MKVNVDIRLTVTDEAVRHHFYVGDPVTLLRKDGVTICGTIACIESDTVIVKRRYGDRPPFQIKVEDIKTIHRDNTEQGAANE